MSFLSLVGVEFKKIKRSKILLILLVATVILWIPSILNVHMNFDMQAEGISPDQRLLVVPTISTSREGEGKNRVGIAVNRS